MNEAEYRILRMQHRNALFRLPITWTPMVAGLHTPIEIKQISKVFTNISDVCRLEVAVGLEAL